jgi:hypothetical protein
VTDAQEDQEPGTDRSDRDAIHPHLRAAHALQHCAHAPARQARVASARAAPASDRIRSTSAVMSAAR